MTINLKEDLSALTSINEIYVKKIFDKLKWCICDGVEEAIKSEESELECDLGFGKIVINITDDTIKYKFIPSVEFNQAVVDTVVGEKNVLEDALEKSLVSKVTKLYKDLL